MSEARKKLLGYALLGQGPALEGTIPAVADEEWDKLMEDIKSGKLGLIAQLPADDVPPDDLDEVEVASIPQCSFCGEPAHYDAKTRMGPWAYMCEKCYGIFGVGLGLGKGQRLANNG